MNPKVMEIAQINLRGNTIDHCWFQNITLANGKPYVVAITILSEIFYWYKPTEVKDEQTNQVYYKQKFKADKLQKSYQQLADSFGFTKRQVQEACKFLKEQGLITLELRTIDINGTRLSNVLFIEPVPEAIRRISIMYQKQYKETAHNVPSHSNEIPITLECDTLPRYNETPMALERETNTEITTEITTNKNKNNNNKGYALISKMYQENFGVLNPLKFQNLCEWADDTSIDLVLEAMKRAALSQSPSLNLVIHLLREWNNSNVKTVEEVAVFEQQKIEKKQKQKNQRNTGSRKPIRQEIIPEWLGDKSNENSVQGEVDLEEQRRLLEQEMQMYKKKPE